VFKESWSSFESGFMLSLIIADIYPLLISDAIMCSMSPSIFQATLTSSKVNTPTYIRYSAKDYMIFLMKT
jgi:hypothetical protein